MKLTKKSETASKITFTYDKPAGAVEGYVYYASGARVSKTMDPNDLEVTFGKVPSGEYAVEAVGFEVLGRADWPDTPPPVSLGRGIGYWKLGGSQHPPSNPDRYDLIMLGGSGFPWPHPNRAVGYASGTNVVQTWNAGVPYQTALANGWLLKDSSGNLIVNKGYPGHYLGDVGLPAYQQAWCQGVEQMVRAWGADGFYNDDCINFGSMWWNAVPAKYPTPQTWDDAMISFCAAVGAYFRPKGIYVAHNAHAWNPNDGAESNNGMRKARWFARIGPHTDGLMAESWMRSQQGVRKAGLEWWNNWEGWKNLHQLCNGLPYPVTGGTVQIARPVDFLTIDQGSSADRAMQRYILATFLLDYNKLGAACTWATNDNTDPWSTEYNMLPLGDPDGPATKNGNVWTRRFSDGAHTVTVDPVAGTASIV